MLCTVASMFTTTPRLSPFDAATPSPASFSSPPGRTSATTAITLAVPMSSPTTRSLYSFAIFLCPPFASFFRVLFLRRVGAGGGDAPQAQRIAIGVPQIGRHQRLGVAPVARRHLRQRLHEPLRALGDLFGRAAPQFHHRAGVQFDLPATAR